MGFGLVVWENLFFFHCFQGRNLLIKKLEKGWGFQKEGGSNIKGKSFFLFYQSKLMSYFIPVIPVSPDTTLKKDGLDKYCGLDTRSILK